MPCWIQLPRPAGRPSLGADGLVGPHLLADGEDEAGERQDRAFSSEECRRDRRWSLRLLPFRCLRFLSLFSAFCTAIT